MEADHLEGIVLVDLRSSLFNTIIYGTMKGVYGSRFTMLRRRVSRAPVYRSGIYCHVNLVSRFSQ